MFNTSSTIGVKPNSHLEHTLCMEFPFSKLQVKAGDHIIKMKQSSFSLDGAILCALYINCMNFCDKAINCTFLQLIMFVKLSN
jgi:hypothetical protein